MSSSSDFWTELSQSLQAIVGSEKGRSVVISPMSGVIVVRAMPDELKNVAAYLKASQISIERQVIWKPRSSVQLSDSSSGVNWGVQEPCIEHRQPLSADKYCWNDIAADRRGGAAAGTTRPGGRCGGFIVWSGVPNHTLRLC
jgi:hypothetical protein